MLLNQRKWDQAIAELREAIRLKPELADAHAQLGDILANVKHDSSGAEAEFREAIRIKPSFAEYHYYLAVALGMQGKTAEAIVEYRNTIRLEPDAGAAHYNLGNALSGQGKLADAMAEYREAIRIKPDHAEAHCNLADVLKRQGRFREALEHYRRGHELGSRRPDWQYPSAEWVRTAELQVALEARLPAILRGDEQPKDVPRGLDLPT